MSVNKVGRPSLARQRTAEILRAMRTVVARDGIDRVTVAEVAAAAGVKRTLVLHYFGSRDGLMSSFITGAVAEYGDQMIGADQPVNEGSVSERLLGLFEPNAYRSADDLAIWVELVARASRDSAVRARLRELWTTRWLPQIEHQLAVEHPGADSATVAGTAYALSCLVEAHWYFHVQGVVDDNRRQHAQHAARALLSVLQAPARPDLSGETPRCRDIRPGPI